VSAMPDVATPGRPALARLRANVAAWLALFGRRRRVACPSLLWPLSGRSVAWAAATIVLVGASMALLDAGAITGARGLPRWFIDLFEVITQFGESGWFLWPLGAMLAALALAAARPLPRIAALVLGALALRLSFLFLAIAIPGLFIAIVKRLIGRARPFVGGSADPFAYHWPSWDPAYASLPSGHATTAFAAALALGALWRRSRAPMWAFAAVIALSRVVVTAHHPSDVLAGAAVGALGALLVRNWFAARRLVFVVGDAGKVQARPGPSLQRIKRVARRLFAP
jgi:membrane-associated phospholipid phosphatase